MRRVQPSGSGTLTVLVDIANCEPPYQLVTDIGIDTTLAPGATDAQLNLAIATAVKNYAINQWGLSFQLLDVISIQTPAASYTLVI